MTRIGDKMTTNRIMLVALGALVLTCDTQTETVHPTSDNLPPRRDYLIRSDSLPAGISPQELVTWRDARSAVFGVQTVAQIGRLGIDADDDPEVFGMIADVELDGLGNVYVLDRQAAQVRIFDFQGNFVGAIGKPGTGPEEFRDPNALELLSDGRVAVSDRGAALKIFAPTATGYELEASVLLRMTPEGMCARADQVFMSGWQRSSNTIIHQVVVASNGIEHSFGHGYRSSNWLVQSQLSDGRVACLGEPLRVIFAFELIPLLRGYDARKGELVWQAGVAGYAQMRVTEINSTRGQPAVSFSARGVQDNLVSVTPVTSGHVLLQYVRGNPEEVRSGTAKPSTRTYLVDVVNGHGALISDTMPLVTAMDSRRQVAMWLLPYPRLELRSVKSPRTWEN